MKINLAENMLRFGVKNLNETSTWKVKTLAEQEQAPAADQAIQVKQIPNSSFNYAVGGGGSDQATKAPLAVILDDSIDFLKYNGTTTANVEFRADLIAFGTVVDSETKYSGSVKATNGPTSLAAVEQIASHIKADVPNTLTAIMWLYRNYGTKLQSGATIGKFLEKFNSQNALQTIYNFGRQNRLIGEYTSLSTWEKAFKQAGIF